MKASEAISIRRIVLGEANRYRQIRLASLKESPAAFSSTYTDTVKRDEDSWHQQADENAVSDDRALFFALENGIVIGLAGIYRDGKDAGTGELCQVWVDAAHRGTRVAQQLMDALMAWVWAHDFTRVIATIRAGNGRAVRFYEKHGFVGADDLVGPLPGDVVLVRRLNSGS